MLATLHEPPDLNRYGVIAIAEDKLHVTDIVEKPARGKEPSREASIGRFLYAPDFLDVLEAEWKRHGTGEFFHTPAVLALARNEAEAALSASIPGSRRATSRPSSATPAPCRS